MLRFYDRTYNLLHKSAYNDFMDEWNEANDTDLYFTAYENKIRSAISDDAKEVQEYLKDNTWKKKTPILLKKSLERFEKDYCVLAMVLFFEDFEAIYIELIDFFNETYSYKISLPAHLKETKRGNPNFIANRISNKRLLEIVKEANELIKKDPELYTPRRNARSSKQLNYALNDKFKEYEPERIGDYFRKNIVLENGRFRLRTEDPCRKMKYKYVY